MTGSHATSVARPAETTYPVSVDARLDEPLSRWLWLVKWLLAIPHFFVLVLLWMAFVVLTVIAFFAILIDGRYPRQIFDFNVGVMRWTWRVSFYATSALGTDRYPPFSLVREPDYPATLDVVYTGGVGGTSAGLIAILTVVAGAILLFRGSYPRDMFDLIVDLNRWVWRVVAYVALMRDEYPPFRRGR